MLIYKAIHTCTLQLSKYRYVYDHVRFQRYMYVKFTHLSKVGSGLLNQANMKKNILSSVYDWINVCSKAFNTFKVCDENENDLESLQQYIKPAFAVLSIKKDYYIGT